MENDVARVTFSSEGAVAKSWILKGFTDESEKPQDKISWILTGFPDYGGKPLDVINGKASTTLGFPMSLGLPDQELAKKLNSALFVATPGEAVLIPPAKLEFAFSDGRIQAKKAFSFTTGYEVQVEVSVFDGQRYLPTEVIWPGGFGDHSLQPTMKESVTHIVYGTADEIEKEAQRKLEQDKTVQEPLQLAGMDDRYFAAILLPAASDQVSFKVGRRPWNPPGWTEDEPPKEAFAALMSRLPKPLSFRLFVGPKKLDVLKAVNPPLDRLVDFGWFSFVARPLFLGLCYIYDHWTQNYGWAIVLLTVLINLAMFPLRLKQIRSAQEMQRIAPLAKSIQDKYKGYKFNDPRKQKMNQEMMKLYKDHGVNPLSGCLPMIIQLPFLYGFYRVLDLSIEMRHAPWILWVKDLSARDPLYILPSLMVITMFILQKMTPVATADPAQQRMMMIMPIVFGFMFFSFASGLVLYWLTGNVISIGQQMLMNRFMPLRPVGPPPRKGPAKET